jgi:formylglycine-generating enzyme required for sulfatase activity
MVTVAGGTFIASITPVTISSFKIDKFEVTYELWTQVRNWAYEHGYTDLPVGRNGYYGTSNHPVTEVDWYDIVKWCNARSERDGLSPVYYTSSSQDTIYKAVQININIDAIRWTADGYRLPTETEWEFAARGGKSSHGYTYSGGDSLDSVAWYGSNSGYATHTVGTKQPNELGIYDMNGNVMEWCWDWYISTYPLDSTDPKGPTMTQSQRLFRGASFYGDEYSCRLGVRFSTNPNQSDYASGFRCVRK